MYGEDKRFPTPRRRGYYPTDYVDKSADDWFRGGLGNMVRMFGSDLPKEFENLTRIVQGPTGDVRAYEDNFVVVTRGDRRYRGRTILKVPVE